MEATRLIDPAFWSSPEPAAPGAELPKATGLPDGLVFFQTSGSTGEPRWIGLGREALLLSAAVVNRHLDVRPDSVWGLALPIRHVGGFGVAARAFEAGCRLAVFPGKWEPVRFVGWLETERVTHLSLVPTQVHDLVAARLRAPRGLKAIVVGGGAMENAAGRAARDLGWPVLASYGMTEAGSQIATQGLELLERPYEAGSIEILPHWEARAGESGALEIRGQSLFSGTLARSPNGWSFSPRSGDWWETSDRVHLEAGKLTPLGRRDALVKILGELVDPLAIERELGLASLLVLALPDARRGHRLVAALEDPAGKATAAQRVADWNLRCPGFCRIDELLITPAFPRSELGKIRRAEVAALLRDAPI